ncbi:chemotaxis protein CheA [Fulvimarina sp. 2208YS6-2-32]|uniref:Chemotaxis protein CheA n=1 Tax=Fulvimarina uroteuthidis TaxID=3098149 RepID=A0ABU5HXL8_9HYPH|nr:chemotaxis protein CheA [Fulvimarina sp. 2208YS6-2-32]MDY8107622.1 chemotaxis protein CheA [Fulvimarina sp. 2208YS6-2-32]
MHNSDPNETFLAEARELLEQLEEALLDLEKRPDDAGLVNTTFRALHTLKGSGGMFGPPAMAAFAHRLEDAFEKVRQGLVPLTPTLVGVFLQSTDQLRRLLFEAGGDHDAESARLVAALEAEVGTSGPATGAAPAERPAAFKEAREACCVYRIRMALPKNALVYGTNPLTLLDELADLGEITVTACTDDIPDLATLEPRDLHIRWLIELATDQGHAAIEDVFIFVDEPGAITIEALDAPALSVEPADATDAADAAPSRTTISPEAGTGNEPPTGETSAPRQDKGESQVRVSASRLDTLLDQVGELVIAQTRLATLAHNRHDPALSAIVEEVERLSADLRDSAMDMRMLPIEQLFGRYRRVVRDLSGNLGKEIELTMSGEETELDKTVLDRLGDPLVHIIRNSVDHGIEDPEVRVARGKPRRGRLQLSARQSGTEIIITVEDDGAGLNRQRIRDKAIANGVIAPDAELSEREIDELIFHPGLSTAQSVSNLSGRGVGMDVVKRTIQDLHGTIEILTQPGLGTRFVLRLPLTLAIIDGLQVAVGHAMCILPLSSVEECVELDQVATRTSNGRNFVDIRGTMVQLLWMDKVFGTDRRGSVVAVVETETGKIGVVVDQVIGQHQTVIKPLSPLHRHTPGLAGATILGDGSVALILDVGALARRSLIGRPMDPTRSSHELQAA